MEPAHQYQNGGLRVIGYASRLFNAAERSYCTTRQELAAVVFGLKRFRQYILGRKVWYDQITLHSVTSAAQRTQSPSKHDGWILLSSLISRYGTVPGRLTGQMMPCRAGHVKGLVRVYQCNRNTGAVVVKSASQYEN